MAVAEIQRVDGQGDGGEREDEAEADHDAVAHRLLGADELLKPLNLPLPARDGVGISSGMGRAGHLFQNLIEPNAHGNRRNLNRVNHS